MDREKNARREAERQGFILRKSRIDGTWTVIDLSRRRVFGSRDDQGWSLEDIEDFLEGHFLEGSPSVRVRGRITPPAT